MNEYIGTLMSSIGLFGKMPSTGDFVSRALSPRLCDGIDRFLQAALLAATAEGMDRSELLEHSMPVMLTIRPGALCVTGFNGLCYPSCDRVGREFPMCVGLETAADSGHIPLSWPSNMLTRSLCQAISTALQQKLGPDELLEHLPTTEQWISYAREGAPFDGLEEETVPPMAINQDHYIFIGPEASISVSGRALCTRIPSVAQAIGTIVGCDGAPAAFFGSRTLLSWTPFAALFDGRWEHWGWSGYKSFRPYTD
jgi:type VI secretion system protein ImpM